MSCPIRAMANRIRDNSRHRRCDRKALCVAHDGDTAATVDGKCAGCGVDITDLLSALIFIEVNGIIPTADNKLNNGVCPYCHRWFGHRLAAHIEEHHR